jgi:peroxiredoxin
MRKLSILLTCAFALLAVDGPRRAPGFALFDSRMEVFDLYDYRGKPVLLEFMETTCPHCVRFADVLHDVQVKYGKRIQILSVVEAAKDNSSTVARYVSEHRVDYPILFDAGQMAYSYVRGSSLDFPHVYLIDANGYVQGDWVYIEANKPVFEGKQLYTELDKLLGPAPAAPAIKKK